MKINIGKYLNYKDYILDFEKKNKDRLKGFRSRLAELAQCQSAYVSQVLNVNSSTHFSLEQALRVCELLQLNPSEKKYFLLLVEHSRSSSEELKAHFLNEIEPLRKQLLSLKAESPEFQPDPKVLNYYYTHWHYSAIHMALMNPKCREVDKLSKALRLPRSKVEETLQLLAEGGFVKLEGKSWIPVFSSLHQERSEAWTYQHFLAYRLKAIQNFSHKDKSPVHYTGVSSMSLKDAEDLRLKVLDFIRSYLEQVKKSGDDAIYNLNIDFYSLIEE